MSETLLEKLGRIEKELSELKAVKPVKQIDYSDDVLSIKSANTELTKKITLLSGQLEESLKRILTLENAKPIAQIDYSKGISILEGINKELTKKLSDLNAKYYELNKELLVIKNKKPIDQVDYSADILALQKQLSVLSHKISKPIDLPFVKTSSFDLMVKNETAEKNKLIERLQFLENKKEIKQHDFKPEMQKLNLSIEKVKRMMADGKIDIKKEIEKVVNIAYVTHLYRNK